MTEPRKLVEEARAYHGLWVMDDEPVADPWGNGDCLCKGHEGPVTHPCVVLVMADALASALDREADGEAGWTAAEMGEPIDESKSVQWLDGWEYYKALDRCDELRKRAERAEAAEANLRLILGSKP